MVNGFFVSNFAGKTPFAAVNFIISVLMILGCSGFSIFGSSFFTAFGDGLTSALISFLRTLVFQIAVVLLFPLLWKLDGIWRSIVAAEVMSVLMTALFLLGKQKKYGY